MQINLAGGPHLRMEVATGNIDAGGGTRTRTALSRQRILSPLCRSWRRGLTMNRLRSKTGERKPLPDRSSEGGSDAFVRHTMIGLTPQLLSDSASRPGHPLCLRSRGPGFEESQGLELANHEARTSCVSRIADSWGSQ